jgi:hypothetical protein
MNLLGPRDRLILSKKLKNSQSQKRMSRRIDFIQSKLTFSFTLSSRYKKYPVQSKYRNGGGNV